MTSARAAGTPAAIARPPSAAVVAVAPPVASPADFPPDVARLLDLFARIERRRQARLAAERAQAFPAITTSARRQEAC